MAYKRLSDYVRDVSVRNKDLKVTNLLGLSVYKEFMPSIAYTIGTDMLTYKVVAPDQLVYICIDSSCKVETQYNNIILYKQENEKLTELQSLLFAKMGQYYKMKNDDSKRLFYS